MSKAKPNTGDHHAKRRAKAVMRLLGLDLMLPAGVAARNDDSPASYRHRVINAQRSRCYLHGRFFGAHPGRCGKPTRDHVLPRAHNGRNYGNTLFCCSEGNAEKANRWPRPCELIALAAVNARLGIGPST